MKWIYIQVLKNRKIYNQNFKIFKIKKIKMNQINYKYIYDLK